jgi:hypothetical protein
VISEALLEGLEANVDAMIGAHGLQHLSRAEALVELNRLPQDLDGTFRGEDELRNVAELPVEVREWMVRIPRRMWFFARPADGEPFGLGAWRNVDEYNPPYVRLMLNFCWVETIGKICYLRHDAPMPVDQVDDVLPYLIFRAEMLKRSVIAGGHRDRYLGSHQYEFSEPNDLDPETLRTGWAEFNQMRLSPNHPFIVNTDLWRRYLQDRPANPNGYDIAKRFLRYNGIQ